MNIYDRGEIKWTSLMLPEHVQMLQHIGEEKIKKPMLDEQAREHIDQTLKYVMEYHVRTKLTYYNKGRIDILEGFIMRMECMTNRIVLSNDCGKHIPLTNILDVQIVS